MVVLTYALTIHECQGQTLPRIILLLGRLPGLYVGKITWPLLYVALSRTKKLSHIKFFPTGSTKYYHSMYFAHLLKLRMPANLKKWYRSYIDHCWDRNVLRNEHLQSVRLVEKRLKCLGEDKAKRLLWTEMQPLVKQLGFKTTTRDKKPALFCKLREHMVKRSLWKTSKNCKPPKTRVDKRRKRKAQEVVSKKSQKPKALLQNCKRIRGSTERKKQRRKSTLNRSSHKRKFGLVDSPASSLTHRSPQGTNKKCLGSTKVVVSRVRKRKHDIENPYSGINLSNFVSLERLTFKGLENLGNTFYFNSVIQCL